MKPQHNLAGTVDASVTLTPLIGNKQGDRNAQLARP